MRQSTGSIDGQKSSVLSFQDYQCKLDSRLDKSRDKTFLAQYMKQEKRHWSMGFVCLLMIFGLVAAACQPLQPPTADSEAVT